MRSWRIPFILALACVPAVACGRATDGGRRAAETAPKVVVLVRHAEKLAGEDPGLSEGGEARAAALAHVLSAWRPDAIYVSQFRRTRDTARPLAEARDLVLEAVDAGEVEGLAARIRAGASTRVVVVGHSNTVPALLRALGADDPDPGAIPEDVYDDLFVVTLPADGGAPGLLHLKYGAPTPG